MEIFLVFQGGASDEPLLGVYSTRSAAEASVSTSSLERDYIVRYVLNEETHEFESAE